MKAPVNITDTPKGDWKYTQPESGMPFREQHPKALEAAVFQHRLANMDLGLDITGNWQQRLWSDVCDQNPHVLCRDEEDKGSWPNLADVWHFVQTMWHWRRGGGGFVTQEEAERRAQVCLTGANGQACPYNRHFVPCLGCRGVSDEIEKLLEGRATKYDGDLFHCEACGGCKISTKIHFPLEAISVDESKLPAYCWQRK